VRKQVTMINKLLTENQRKQIDVKKKKVAPVVRRAIKQRTLLIFVDEVCFIKSSILKRECGVICEQT
jgi:hypothetical protein